MDTRRIISASEAKHLACEGGTVEYDEAGRPFVLVDARYGWIITNDLLADAGPHPTNLNAVGMIGPGNIDPEDEPRLRAGAGLLFRMLDDDGIVYYEGRLVGQTATGFEPLDDFGTPNAGCTSIEHWTEVGGWRAL